jgi:RNase P/RNase MRP subunit p30
MIIDSHEHLMLPTEMQIKKLEKAGVDKAILFCTAPHPEKASTLEELKKEMGVLYKILAGSNSKEDDLKRMRNNIQDLIEVIQINSMDLVLFHLNYLWKKQVIGLIPILFLMV